MSAEHDSDNLASRLSLKDAETVILVTAIVQSALGLVTIFFSLWGTSAATFCEGLHLLAGVGLWLIVYLHQRLRRVAREEEQEMAELEQMSNRQQRSALFESEGIDPFSARTRLARFEKYFLPILTALGAISLGVLAWLMFRRLRPSAVLLTGKERYLPTLALLWSAALLCLLFGRYAAGMSTQRPWRPLRAGGSFMVSNAMACFLVGAGQGAAYIFKVPAVDRWIGYAIAGGVGLIAVETLLNLLLDFYRPRVSGVEQRRAYDSRLLGLFTQPAGIVRTAAETLDYQFGFKVSETWFYKFMERAIAPLILFQLATLYLMTCFVIVGSDEQAIVERLGKYRGTPCGPGFHVKLPWPFETVHRYPANRIHLIVITGGGEAAEGEGHAHEHEGAEGLEDRDIIWAAKHQHSHVYFIVASKSGELQPATGDQAVSVSYLAGTFHIQYRISDVQAYHFNFADGEATLKALAQREIVKYMTSIDFYDFFGPGRERASREIRARTQRAADQLRLGVTVIFVGVHDLHPPHEVAESFENVFAAEIRRETIMADARTQREILLQEADQKKETMLSRAEVEKFRRVHLSEKQALRFRMQLEAFRKGGKVYLAREFLRTLRTALKDTRKVLVPVPTDAKRVMTLNAEEKPEPGSLGLGLQEGE